jgi:hypothetical protein
MDIKLVNVETNEIKTDADWEKEIAASKEPKQEEYLPKAEHIPSIKLNTGMFETIDAELNSAKEKDPNFDTKMQDRSSYEYNLAISARQQTRGRQREYLIQMLKEITSANKNLTNINQALQDKYTTKRPKKDGNKELVGREALITTFAKTKGIKKVFLINSGFYIVMRSLTMEELHTVFTSADMDFKEYGMILGAPFYLAEDLLIKQKFIELLPTIIIDSNLVGWNKPGSLENNISIQDYDTLLWAACVLLYPNGISLDLVCTNKECHAITHDFKIDLHKCRYNVLDDIPKECIEQLISATAITSDQIDSYKTKLPNSNKQYVVGSERYFLEVPSLLQYLSWGTELLAHISSIVKGKLDINDTNTYDVIIYNLYQMVAPWISKVEFLDEEGNMEVWTSDKMAIRNLLEISRTESSVLVDHLKEFIKDTKFTHIVYTTVDCPSCHKKAEEAINDFLPIDVQRFFFFLAKHRLK